MTEPELPPAEFNEHLGDGIVLESCGGWCPVQAQGTVDGRPFYFRARDGISLAIGPEGGTDDDAISVSCGTAEGWYVEAEHPSGYAGYMSDAEVLFVLRVWFASFRAGYPGLRPMTPEEWMDAVREQVRALAAIDPGNSGHTGGKVEMLEGERVIPRRGEAVLVPRTTREPTLLVAERDGSRREPSQEGE